MINIKSVLHMLRVKWMIRLCQDRGMSWSRIIWNKLNTCILVTLLSGLTAVVEQDIEPLPLFYCAMICSYTYVNNIFFQCNKKLQL